jgi:hypothetical protein
VKKDRMERARGVRCRIPEIPIFCSVGEENACAG